MLLESPFNRLQAKRGDTRSVAPARVLDSRAEADRTCDELVERWRRGDRVAVESYFPGWPGGPPEGDDLFELIYTEYLVRDELGEPAFEPLAARFPDQADRLRRQVSFHRDLADSRDDPSAGVGIVESTRFDLKRGREPGETTWPAPAGYEIIRVLGRGGMGVVYEAWQVQLNRPVALKMIRAGIHASPEDLLRFVAEAEVIARLKHPNIVQVHAFGETDGQPFFEMEYVGGGSLAERLNGTPWSTRDASTFLETIARAIHEAHCQGVVHRDLKPSNILLASDGSPKIVDFGLAKLIGSDSGLTRTDAVLGSPAYMAPEQASGLARAVGPAADVYALGAVYYELLTGRSPFVAGSALEALDLVRNAEPISPSRLRPGLPRDLETICLRCLPKDPARRYASAEALADDLGRWLGGKSILARPTGPLERTYRWSLRNRVVAALLASISLILVGGTSGMAVLWTRARFEAANARNFASKEAEVNRELKRISAGLTLDRGLTLAGSGDVARGLCFMARAAEIDADGVAGLNQVARANLAAWSPIVPRPLLTVPFASDPTTVALTPDREFVVTDGSVTFRDLANIATVGPTCSRVKGKIRRILYRPDNLVAATLSENSETILLWDTSTWLVRGEPIQQANGIGKLAFSPDGSILVASSGTTLRFWDSKTGRAVSEPFSVPRYPTSVVFSPDGSTLLVAIKNGGIQRFDGRTGKAQGEPVECKDGWVLAFHPDGSRFALGFGPYGLTRQELRDGSGVQVYDAATLKPIGPRMAHEIGVCSLAYRPDGRGLVAGDYGGTVRLWDEAGRPIGEPLRGEGVVDHVEFSPDGTLALAQSSSRSVRICDATTGRLVGSALEQAELSDSRFTDDGRQVVLIGKDMTRSFDLTPVIAPGRAAMKNVNSVTFSPDGRYLLTVSGEIARLRSTEDLSPVGWPMPHRDLIQVIAISPDGQRIATGGRDASLRIWDAEGRSVLGPIALSHWASALRFSPDGRRLLAADESGEVRLIDVETGKTLAPPQKHRSTFDGSHVGLLFFSADGRLGFSVGQSGSLGRIDGVTGRSLGPIGEYPIQSTQAFQVKEPVAGNRTLLMVSGGSIHRIDVETGRDQLPAIGREIRSVSFLADGRTIVSGGDDKAIRFWDTVTGREIGSPITFLEPVDRIVVCPDGRSLILEGADGHGQFWDVASRKPVGTIRTFDPKLFFASPSPDGRFYLMSDEITRLYKAIEPEQTPTEALAGWVSARTGLSLDAQGTIVPLPVPDLVLGSTRESSRPAGWHSRAAAELTFRGNHAAALWHLARLKANQPDDGRSDALLWETLTTLGQTAEADRVKARAGQIRAAQWDAYRSLEDLSHDRWAEAAAGLDRVIASNPPNAAFFHDARAQARAQLEDWRGASADTAAGNWRQQRQFHELENLALIALVAEDHRFYREIVERFVQPWLDNPQSIKSFPQSFMALLATLGPDGVDDPSRIIALTEPGVKDMTPMTSEIYILAHSMALYRAGRLGEVIDLLSVSPIGRKCEDFVEARAILAMSHHRLGHQREAMDYMKLLENAPPESSQQSRLSRLIMIREARSVVREPDSPTRTVREPD